MAGIDNDVFFGTNVDFRGVEPVTGQMIADGQLLIGAAAAPYIRANYLSAGSGINIVNGPGTITISTSAAGITWDEKSVNFNANINYGYFVTNTATVTLPNVALLGDTITINSDTNNPVTIQAGLNQFIRVGYSITLINGTIVTTSIGDSVTLVYRASTLTWEAISALGNWTIN